MNFYRYNNYRVAMFFVVILTAVIFLGSIVVSPSDYKLDSGMMIILGMPFVFLLYFEIDAHLGAFYDTVYCDENGVTIKTRKKTVKLSWDEVKYIRAVRTKGALIGWEINAVDGEKYKMYPPQKKALMDYINSLQLNVEVRT